jgi:hypothetical protein
MHSHEGISIVHVGFHVDVRVILHVAADAPTQQGNYTIHCSG